MNEKLKSWRIGLACGGAGAITNLVVYTLLSLLLSTNHFDFLTVRIIFSSIAITIFLIKLVLDLRSKSYSFIASMILMLVSLLSLFI